MSDPDGDLVTVGTFSTVGGAEAGRGMLEAAGIPALVGERDALRLDPFRPQQPPRIRLKVRATDAERAREMLAAQAG